MSIDIYQIISYSYSGYDSTHTTYKNVKSHISMDKQAHIFIRTLPASLPRWQTSLFVWGTDQSLPSQRLRMPC